MQLSILVVSYNTCELTVACIRSVVAETSGADYEILLVDNASSDGSPEQVAGLFPAARVIRSQTNLGFARANNRAAHIAKGTWLLLLNPDTVILDRAIEKALAFASQQEHEVIVGGRTLFPDGRLNPLSCHDRPTPWSILCAGLGLSRVFPRSKLFNSEAIGNWQRDSVRAVDAVSGCFLLIQKRTWERLRGFDESFFMYGEETDLCLRAKEIGIKCIICPAATLVHLGGASERLRADKMVRLLNAKVRLVKRHWRWPWRSVGHHLVLLWPLSRVLAYQAARLLRHPKSATLEPWVEVWSRRAEVLSA